MQGGIILHLYSAASSDALRLFSQREIFRIQAETALRNSSGSGLSVHVAAGPLMEGSEEVVSGSSASLVTFGSNEVPIQIDVRRSASFDLLASSLLLAQAQELLVWILTFFLLYPRSHFWSGVV